MVPIGRRWDTEKPNPRFQAPEADLGLKKFNWSSVTSISSHFDAGKRRFCRWIGLVQPCPAIPW